MKPEAIFTAPGQRVGPLFADGRAGIAAAHRVARHEGIDYVGMLPPALQTTIIYATARRTNAGEPAAADALAKFLTAKAVEPTAKEMRLDPA